MHLILMTLQKQLPDIGGVTRTFEVRTVDCVVENGTYSAGGCTLKTRRFNS